MPGVGANPLPTVRWSFLFHPLFLRAAPPLALVLRSPTTDADSSVSPHLGSLPLLLPQGHRPLRQPSAGTVLHNSRQRDLPVLVLPRSPILHPPPGSSCRPNSPLFRALLFSSYVTSAKWTHRFRHMPGFTGVLRQRRRRQRRYRRWRQRR